MKAKAGKTVVLRQEGGTVWLNDKVVRRSELPLFLRKYVSK